MLRAALVFNVLGGICAVIGGLTLGGVMPLIHASFPWSVWFTMGFAFLLGSISFGLIGRRTGAVGED